MITERIDLGRAHLDLYVPDVVTENKVLRPFVIVCPGGGYFFCNKREAEAVALYFNSWGFASAVLYYSTEEGAHYPIQLVELASAVDYVKKKSGNWFCDKKNVFVAGFSAGGHLAASLGTFWNKEKAIAMYDCQVAGLVLCYAVTISGEYENKRTFDNLCGNDCSLRKWTSLVDKVDSHTPPCFIWSTYEDALVPVENSIYFALALRQNSVPFELHIYEKGPHAMSLASDYTSQCKEEMSSHVASWKSLAAHWIKEKVYGAVLND